MVSRTCRAHSYVLSQSSSTCRTSWAMLFDNSTFAVWQARHSKSAWARHVERVVSWRDVTGQVEFGLITLLLLFLEFPETRKCRRIRQSFVTSWGNSCWRWLQRLNLILTLVVSYCWRFLHFHFSHGPIAISQTHTASTKYGNNSKIISIMYCVHTCSLS